MSNLASGILGTAAVAFALGAVHLEVASGNDLLGPVMRGDASLSTPTRLAVNRDAKSNRESAIVSAEGVTISFRLPGVDNTSIMMRVPTGNTATEKRAPQPVMTGSNTQRPKVGCEGSVSVLSAVAKTLPVSRCVT